MRAGHEKMMPKLDTPHERMAAYLRKIEAMDLEENPEEMQFEAVHWEVPKEVATVSQRKRPGEIVDPGINWLPPVGR
jgi:hypothetical protein